MFRRDKSDVIETAKPEAGGSDLSAPPLKPFSRRGQHVSDHTSGVAADEPPQRPGLDVNQRRPGAGVRPRVGASEFNKLTVGRDIHLKGEITSCDKLIVEGHVEASTMVARVIEVAPTGVFKGDAQVEEADISGRFEGTLVAREKLTVRSKGRVSGEIRYGTIVIESGGEISGAMQTLAPDENAGAPASPNVVPGSTAKD